jgi:hypothetical protein
MGGRKGMVLVGVALSVPALVGKWMDHLRPGGVPDWIFLLPAVVFVLLLFGLILRFILASPRINSEVLCAGVAGYLLLGLAWAFAYIMLAAAAPGAFVFTTGPAVGNVMKGFTAIYYSFITLCTIGYGDIVPVHGIARMLAVMEGIIGTLYMAILVARLVGDYSMSRRSEA